MNRIILFLMLILLCGSAAAQDYFPLPSIQGNYTLEEYTTYGPNNQSYKYSNYYDHITQKIIINGETFYYYEFGNRGYYFRNDADSLKLYIFLPQDSTVHLAADFNLELDQKFESYIDGERKEYFISIKDTVFSFGKQRRRIKIYHPASSFIFEEGMGLTVSFIVLPRIYPDTYFTKLQGAIIDSIRYNPVSARISSTTLRKTYSIYEFPAAVTVRGDFSHPAFHDICYADVKIVRGDTIAYSGKYYANVKTLQLRIDIGPSVLQHDDTMYTKIYFKDKSIFFNEDVHPDTGYIISRIIDPFTGTEEADTPPGSFEISAPYPNPFNSSAAVRFYLPEAVYVNLTLYDILGNKVRVLNDGELSRGSHKINIDAGGLTSGIYLLYFYSARESRTYKILHLK